MALAFEELDVRGAFAITSRAFTDDRGSFARIFCSDEFGAQGLETHSAQSRESMNTHRATLRGMHLQLQPYEETKIVRCTAGAVWDAVVDLRPSSSSFGKWAAVELRPDDPTALYIPRGVAHGFLTLVSDSRVEYMISAPYAPEDSVGVRWDDPAIGIEWPFEPAVISDRDRALPTVDLAHIQSVGLEQALRLANK
jgi:dTDP-4-dehydrorhamnose 3,5-epimerase